MKGGDERNKEQKRIKERRGLCVPKRASKNSSKKEQK